jgi:hypothetical protein
MGRPLPLRCTALANCQGIDKRINILTYVDMLI